MAEVYTSPFSVTLSSAYTAGDTTLSVSGAAPVAIQGGTFRVRLGNASNTVLAVTGGAATTTWSVTAEFNDANASSGATVYGCEFSPGALTSLLHQPWPNAILTAPPAAATLTWANQGSATVTDRGGCLLLTAPPSGSDNIRSVTKAYPATPFTFTVCFAPNFRSENYSHGGICITDGTKYITVGIGWNTSIGASIPTLGVYHWTNSSTNASAVYQGATNQLPYYWLQIEDNGTNFFYRTSLNGVDFSTGLLASESRSFLTPTRIGAFMDPVNVTYGMSGLYFSWSGI